MASSGYSLSDRTEEVDMAGIFKNGLAEGALNLLQYIIRKTCSLGNTKIMNSWSGFAGISQDN